MANPHLSDCLAVTLHRIAATSPETEEVLNQKRCNTLLLKLEVFLLAGTKVLADADQKSYDSGAVKRWLTEFQDASFHAENILEDISEEVLRRRVVSGSSIQELNWAQPNYLDLLREKMEGVIAILESLVGHIALIGLRDCGAAVEAQRKPMSHIIPLFHEPAFVREADKLALIDLMLPDLRVSRRQTTTPYVISVNGMPGIGKTTLVAVVYNDNNIANYFDIRVWICVGQDFDVLRVTKDVLQQASNAIYNNFRHSSQTMDRYSSNTEDLYSLQQQLRNKLAGNRFLLVLDDIWSEKSSEWKIFLAPFTGLDRCKIILTTQSDTVSSITQAAQTYQLRPMTNSECWELICKSIFWEMSILETDGDVIVEKSKGLPLADTAITVGKKIAEQCKGLPLAATTVASHLRSKPHLCDWKDVSNNFLYYTTDVLEVLRRSYDSLPCHLKRCFAFCSIFPKGYVFDRKNLVLLWMAVDLLYQPRSNQRLEDIGNKYLDDLVARSFLLSLESKKRFTMHDFMNDLATSTAGELCFRLEDDSLVQIPKRVRHLSFCGKQWDSSVASTFLREAEYLRTFLPLGVSPPRLGSSELAEKALEPLPHFSEQALSGLRVLSLSHYSMTKIPKSFEKLKQLRYLDLSNTEVKEIPEFVFSLRNLQTLFLSNCRQLRRLTANIVQLINLCYLVLLWTPLVEMPRGISNLRNLQRLSNFVIGKLSGAGLQELRELSHLRGTLHISELQNVVSVKEDPCLKEKPFLKKLILTWSVESSSSNSKACDQTEVLKMLQPHPNLEKVCINSYGGEIFPKWLGDTSFISMTSVSLTSCNLCISLPPLGQLPNLRYLSIEKFKILQKVGLEFFYGDNDNVSPLEPFPSLLTLSFSDMPRWEEWRCPELEGTILPRLNKLTIRSCPSLTEKIPKLLPDFTQVTISDAPLRSDEVCGKSSEPSFSKKEELHGESNELYSPEPSLSKKEELHGESKELYIPEPSFSKKEELHGESNELYSPEPSLSKKEELHGESKELYIPEPSFSKKEELHGESKELYIPEPESSSETDEEIDVVASKPYQKHSSDAGTTSGERMPQRDQDEMGSESSKVKKVPELTKLSASLKRLHIEGCPELIFLPESLMQDCPNLEDLLVVDCHSLETLSGGYPSTTLKTLYIRDCLKLEFIESQQKMLIFPQLEDLFIGSSCNTLCSFPLALFPKLKSLSIKHCEQFSSFTVTRVNDRLALEALEITGCPKLEIFPKEGLRTLKLVSLLISKCRILKELPADLSTLTSLLSCHINECPEIKGIPSRGFPKGLQTLCISRCQNLRPTVKWELVCLGNLRDFEMEGGNDDIESFPEKGLLPQSLYSLRISGFKNLRTLDYEGLEDLPTLEMLEISGCDELESLPDEDLPSSLSLLRINDCSTLKENIISNDFEWFKIKHIQLVEIDGEELLRGRKKTEYLLPPLRTQLKLKEIEKETSKPDLASRAEGREAYFIGVSENIEITEI